MMSAPMTVPIIDPPAAGERGAADDHRGDRLRLDAGAAGGLSRAETGGREHPGEADEEAAEDVDGDEPRPDVDAREPGGPLIRSDREGRASDEVRRRMITETTMRTRKSTVPRGRRIPGTSEAFMIAPNPGSSVK